MNHVFRLVWSHRQRCLVPVVETHRQGGGGRAGAPAPPWPPPCWCPCS
ncbi:hypothetical protein HML84_20385 [Alcanivorax sp. IO_7]|nr:hypothetical protein HML84_20385 [Alcanivorax sp. IO_7]